MWCCCCSEQLFCVCCLRKRSWKSGWIDVHFEFNQRYGPALLITTNLSILKEFFCLLDSFWIPCGKRVWPAHKKQKKKNSNLINNKIHGKLWSILGLIIYWYFVAILCAYHERLNTSFFNIICDKYGRYERFLLSTANAFFGY